MCFSVEKILSTRGKINKSKCNEALKKLKMHGRFAIGHLPRTTWWSPKRLPKKGKSRLYWLRRPAFFSSWKDKRQYSPHTLPFQAKGPSQRVLYQGIRTSGPCPLSLFWPAAPHRPPTFYRTSTWPNTCWCAPKKSSWSEIRAHWPKSRQWTPDIRSRPGRCRRVCPLWPLQKGTGSKVPLWSNLCARDTVFFNRQT